MIGYNNWRLVFYIFGQNNPNNCVKNIRLTFT